MLCALATAAMDAPGALHAASNAALVSAEYVRLVRRTAYLGVSESLSIVSTIMVVDTMVLGHASINKVTWPGAYNSASNRNPNFLETETDV